MKAPSAELFATLRAWHHANAAPAFVREPIGDDTAYLGGTIDAWWFLARDGRVLEYPGDEAGAVVRELTGGAATWVLADCAWKRRLPELLDLLPAAPEGSSVCLGCDGIRYLHGEATVTCHMCHGLGWRVP